MNIIKNVKSDGIIELLIDLKNCKFNEELFLKELSYDAFYEISFFNTDILPFNIIIRLQELKDKITIIVNKYNLKYYLRELNFYVKMQKKIYISKEHKIRKVQFLALGGSAGSLKKFINIIQALPPSELSVFLVMHQKSDVKSNLADILQSKTEYYEVIEAKSNTKVKPSTIYIAPPHKHMIVAGGFVFLTDDEPKHFSKPSISNTFESLAYEYKDALLAILVCGYGADGSDSLEHIRKNGGTVIIEQLYECQATPMLENAINSKEYDYILSIEDINRLLYNHLHTLDNLEIELYLEEFLEDIYQKYGYDYRHYNKKHILRRIKYSINKLGIKDFIDFRQIVLENVDVFKDLFLDISVNITTLFRNPLTYKILKDEILENFKDRDSIKIWCAGCSSGEEPYSISIILKEMGLLDKSLIYATDLNSVVLQKAKNGIYSNDNYKFFEQHYKETGFNNSLNRYFNNYDDFFAIKDELKEKILFFRHNLVTDGVLNEFQIVFCRNVIIYFDAMLKARVFNLFDDSLEKDGVLVLGESESYDSRKSFETIDMKNKIYRKLY